MKKILSLLSLVVLIGACSSPKYTYNFDHYDYNSGRKKSAPVTASETGTQSPLVLDQQTLVASASEEPVVLAEPHTEVPTAVSVTEAKNDFARKYKAMSKTERKEFREDLKKELKAYTKAKKEGNSVASGQATKQLDHDLKMAIIFGAVGLTLSLFGGVNTVFWVLGVIAIVVGVVFLISWLLRQ